MIHNQPEGLMRGQAIDFPLYPNRGFMIDVARKFFTMDYLRDYVKILSFYKLNELQVHLNDNGFVEFFGNDWDKTYAAFQLESERYPGLTAKDGFYTKAEFRDFQKMAATYGVNVIPEIDVPAHSLAFTHYNPRLAADNKEYGMDHLDLYKQEVYDFVDSLFDEYLSGEDPVFVGPEVHIGTDEYNKKESEQFRHFTNHYLNFVSKYGKTPRLWGSLKVMTGETPVDLTGKVVSAWNYNWMDVNTCLKAGAKVVNLCDWLLYLVPSVNYYHDFLDYQWLYESWMPEMMKKDDPKVEKRHPNFLGAMLAVWNDRVGNGISQQDVHVIKSLLNNREKTRSLLSRSTQTDKMDENVLSPQDNMFMTELYHLMESELSNPELDVTRMTQLLKISRTKFYYKVKGLTGENPSVFFKTYKLNRAAELLKEGKYTISEIADMTGFNTLSHFSKSFKQQFGIPPSEYLK